MALQPSLMPGPATLAPFSTHPSPLDTPVSLQPLCFQSYAHAFRHTWGCASVFTSDFELSALNRSFRSVRINIIPRHLAVLCFHTLTHSFATPKTLTPTFSIICALFAQNTRGGVWQEQLVIPGEARGLLESVPIRRLGRPEDVAAVRRTSCGGRVQLCQRNYVRRRWRSDLELRRAVAVRITRGAGLLAAAAARAARKSACAFSRMSPCAKTALPATRISAPARTISSIVSRATPPSISIRNPKPRALRIRASSSTFFSELGMKCCAPNPGFTDMINTWCTISSTSSNARTGVAGLITTPGLQLCEEIKWSVRSR